VSLTSFIPEVWSARLAENLNKTLVFGQLCNRSWEGDIRRKGDVVHINCLRDITVKPYTPNTDIDDPEQLDGTDMTLSINHAVYYNFYLNDVEAAQANADILDAAMRSAAVKVAEDAEGYILGVIRAGAGIKKTMAPGEGGIYSLLLDIKTAMDLRHVPKLGRKLVIPPAIESELLMDSRFIVGSATADARLREGSVARCAGFDIYVSADLTGEIVAMTEDAVTFASQLCSMETYRREKGFDDAVKGLHLCGAKVIQPDALAVYTVTA